MFGEINMKNILILLLCLIVIGTTVEAKIVKDSLYQIPKTKVAPVIDGIQDNIWKAIDWNMQRWYNVGDPPSATSAADSGVGLAGMSKAMWDANNIYVLVYTVDDIITDIPANANWNQDAVELYFDGANDHAAETSLSGTQYQMTFSHWTMGKEVGHLYNMGVRAPFDTTGMEYKITDVADDAGFPGWMLEVKIPLANLGIDGASAAAQKIGWEVQQDESDDATVGRASMSKWWSNSNNSWANAGIWGTAILSAREVDTVLQIVKAAKAPTIDGTMDAEYKNANPATTNLFRVGDPPGADAADTDPIFGGFVTAYPMWDANNMYIFCDVVDGIITDIPANANWNQDAVELYFDAANDHATGTSLSGTQYQFTFSHWTMGKEVGHLYNMGVRAPFDTTGMEYKIVDHDARGNEGMLTEEGSGWNLEIKIPLANLGIDGASGAGTKLGFEVQLDNSNDATAGRQGMQKWWSASNNSWANAGIWGYAQLTDARIDTRVGSSPNVVSGFELNQNYPNPFNPSTEISFSLAKSEKVKLTVYNLLGKQVAVLVDGTRNAGHQSVTFDAANLSSGVYFYKLEAGSTVLAKKMMLLK
jgi:hypothetical protein